MIERGLFGNNTAKGKIRRLFMSLIVCPECNRSVSDKAIFCPGCGYLMASSLKATPNKASLPFTAESSPCSAALRLSSGKQNQKQTRRKLPNGYGSIKKLSGNRSRPYAAYLPANTPPPHFTSILDKEPLKSLVLYTQIARSGNSLRAKLSLLLFSEDS